MTLCIFNATLVTPQGQRQGGVLCDERGRIAAMLEGAQGAAADTVIVGHGRMLFAGFIDAHVHMRDPGFTHKEDFASGTRAAVCAGVTTVMCMPNTNPPVNNMTGFRTAEAAGAAGSHVDFTLQAAAEPGNMDDLDELWAAGITSFEILMADAPDGVRVDDTEMLTAILARVSGLDAVVGVYAGDQARVSSDIARARAAGPQDVSAVAGARAPEGEASGMATAIAAAKATGAMLVVRQVSTEPGFEVLRRAKAADGAPEIRAEVTPHHLHLDRGALARLGPFAHMLPPLRGPADRAAAVQALADGVADFVASDHAPHTFEEKGADDPWACPPGTPGLDTLVPAVLDLAARGAIDNPTVARVLAETPAQIFGIAGRKGRLAPGADADLVLVDPEMEREVTPEGILSRAGRSPFEGHVLRGWPVLTILRGRVVAETGRLADAEPHGQFLARDKDD